MSRRGWLASAALFAGGVAALLLVRSAKPARPPPAWALVAVAPDNVRSDWRSLPLVGRLGEPQTLAVHERFLNDPDLDQTARLGPFELRWRETGYHSSPPEWVDPEVCDPAACEDVSIGVWSGGGGIYRRVVGLRRDEASDTFIVSISEGAGKEDLGVAFRRVRRP